MSNEHFDRLAAEWDQNPTRRAMTAAVAQAVIAAADLRTHHSVLEYGCGTAALSFLLAPQVGRIVAADASPGMVAEARRKLAAQTAVANIEVLQLDLTRDPLPANRFDRIVSAMALHHIENTEHVLRQLAALLAPDGRLLLADLCAEDGSFHTDMTVPHNGFDPEQLGVLLARLGLAAPRWTIAHRLAKNDREYPLFLLVARRSLENHV